jgi:hypothetical protein
VWLARSIFCCSRLCIAPCGGCPLVSPLSITGGPIKLAETLRVQSLPNYPLQLLYFDMTSCKTVRASSSQCQACDSTPLQDSPSNTLVGSAKARVPLNSCLPPFRSVVPTKLSPGRLSMFRRRVSRPIKVRIDETTRVSRGLRGVLQTHKVFAPGNTDGRPCAELSVWSHERYKCANIVCPSNPFGAPIGFRSLLFAC